MHISPKTAYAAASKIDLSGVRTTLVALGRPAPLADKCIELYRQFMSLHALYPDLRLVPPQAADEAWHIHLDMPTYADDCIALFGHVAEHLVPPEGAEEPEDADAWEVTQQLFARHFDVDLSTEAASPCIVNKSSPCIINRASPCIINHGETDSATTH